MRRAWFQRVTSSSLFLIAICVLSLLGSDGSARVRSLVPPQVDESPEFLRHTAQSALQSGQIAVFEPTLSLDGLTHPREFYQTVLGFFADALCQQTRGLFRLGRTTVYSDGRTAADILWQQGDGASTTAISSWGGYIPIVTRDTVGGGPVTPRTTARDLGAILGHQWAHAVFSLLDEPELQTIMNPLTPQLRHSTAQDYLAAPNTPQQQLYGQSGWDTLVDSPQNDPKRLEIGHFFFPRIHFQNLAPIPLETDLQGCRDELEVVWKERPSLTATRILDDQVDAVAGGRNRWLAASGRQLSLRNSMRNSDGTEVRNVSIPLILSPPTFLALSTDDQTFVTAHDDGTVLLWNNASPEVLIVAENAISALDFEQDRLILAYENGQIVFVQDQQSEVFLTHPRPIKLLRLTDQTLIGWDGETVFHWSLPFARVEESYPLAAASALGRTLTASLQSQTLLVHRQGRLADTLPAAASVSFSLADDTLYAARLDGVFLYDLSQSHVGAVETAAAVIALEDDTVAIAQGADIHLYRLSERQIETRLDIAETPRDESLDRVTEPFRILRGHSRDVLALTFSDNNLLASVADDGEVRLWDLSSDQLPPQILSHPQATALAFSRDGILASASDEIRLWRRSLGSRLYTRIATLSDHRSAVLSLTFSRDGRRLYAGSALPEGEISLWDIETQTRIQRSTSSAVIQTRLSPTAVAAAGYRSVTFWQPRTLTPLGRLEAHDSAIRDLAFSSDGRLLATAGANGVRLWDADSRVLLDAFSINNPKAVLFAVDELLAATEDGLLRLPLKRSLLLDRVDAVLNGNEALRPLKIDPALDEIFVVYEGREDLSEVRLQLRTAGGAVDLVPSCDSLRCWGVLSLDGGGERTLSLWHPRAVLLSVSVSGRVSTAAPWLGVSAPRSLTYSEPFLATLSVLTPFPTTDLEVSVSLLEPNGNRRPLPAADDSVAPDSVADDGRYSLAFSDYQYSGLYALEILAASTATTAQTAVALSTIGTPTLSPPQTPFQRYRRHYFHVADVVVDDHSESFADCTELAADNRDIAGRLETASDVDCFRFQVQEEVSVRVTSLAANADPLFQPRPRLFNQAEDPVVSPIWERGDLPNDGGLILTLPRSETTFTYYLFVDDFHQDVGGGSYMVSVGPSILSDRVSAVERPLLYLSVAERVSEDGGQILVTASLSTVQNEDIRLTLTAIPETATPTADFSFAGLNPAQAEVVIPPRALSATAPLTIVNDSLVEGAEVFRLMATSETSIAINDSPESAVAVTITDDDSATLSLTAVTREVDEGGEFQISLGLSSAVTVDLTAVVEVIEETATADDYRPPDRLVLTPGGPPLTLLTSADDEVEEDETLAFRIVTVETTVLDQLRVVNGVNGEPLRLTIVNDDAAVSLRVSDTESDRLCSMAASREPLTVVEGSTVFVTACLTGPRGIFAVDLRVLDDEDQDLGLETTDYVLSASTLSFDGTMDRALAIFETKDDLIPESSEAFDLALSSPTGSVRIEDGRVTVIVTDNGDTAVVMLEGFEVRSADGTTRPIVSGESLAQGEVLRVRARLTGVGTLNVPLEAVIRIEAAEGSPIVSYSDLGAILTIQSGETVSGLTDVLEMGSAIRQTPLFVSLEGAMAGGAAVGIEGDRFVILAATSMASPVAVAIEGSTTVEEGETLELTVRLTDPSSVSGQVELQLEAWSGSAAVDDDFLPLMEIFSLDAVAPSRVVRVVTAADDLIEGDEDLIVTVGGR